MLDRQPDRTEFQRYIQKFRQELQPKITCRLYPKAHPTHKHGAILVCTYTDGGKRGKYVNVQCNQPLI